MIKINKWFSSTVIQEYLSQIGSSLISELSNTKVTYLRLGSVVCNVEVYDLLSLPLTDLKEKYKQLELYMYLCELRRFREKTGREILEILSKSNVNVRRVSDEQYNVFFNGECINMTFNKNNTISDNGLRTIRKMIIGKIESFNQQVYQYLISQHSNYLKDANEWNSLLDYISDELDSCILQSGQIIQKYKSSRRMPYANQPYIIHYNKISSEMRNFLIASLGIMTCPYCNRQWSVKDDNDISEIHATADLDHFYQKSSYPLFALSLFNFVPSCQICNSRMKGASQNSTLYPYEEGFGDSVKFKLVISDEDKEEKKLLDMWLGVLDPESTKIEIRIDNNETDEDYKMRVQGSKNTFKLEQVYQSHKNKAIETILKKEFF